MISTETVRAYFQNQHARMERKLRRSYPDLRTYRGEDGLEEAIHNTITLAFENVLRCATKGKLEDEDALARYAGKSLFWAIRHTRAGRTITHKPHADKKYGDLYEKMSPCNVAEMGDFVGRSTPIPDAVSFRVDTLAFFATLTERQQGMATSLMAGLSTKDVAEQFGVSPGAVSQFRTRFYRLWCEFFDEV